MSPKILIYIAWAVKAWAIPEKQVRVLRERFPEFEFIYCTGENEALRAIEEVEIAFSSRLDSRMVDRAKRLRWVHSSAAAVEGLLPLADLARHDIVVTNSKGIQAIPIAEQVMAGLLAFARRMNLTLKAQQEKRWIQPQLCDTDWPWMLHGQAMTIIGLGTIGIEVARRANAFGMKVTGIRRTAGRPRPDFVDRVLGPGHLQDGLKDCDVLVICAPYVEKTHRMIGANEIALLNPGAVIVNVARGQIVDEAAMIDALKSGRLRGAALDVFDREPLEPSHPLWSLPNVIVTPHSSGFRESHWDDVIDLFSENLRRFQHKESLLNRVDCSAGY